MQKGLLLFLIVVSVLLCACGKRVGLAPVSESKWQNPNQKKNQHVVMSGETLYAIAFRYDKDYRNLAQINHLQSPYTLKVGQSLTLNGKSKPQITSKSQPKQKRQTNSKPKRSGPTLKLARPKLKEKIKKHSFNGQWFWPADGKIVNTYAPGQGKKGIDIAGNRRGKVHAASSGIVAYAGNGLSSYGNLIIIKHNNQYLTAYGNNAKNFVKEGQQVKKGQVIAQMGMVNRKYWGLHFEIRKAGKPVNPLNYLKKA